MTRGFITVATGKKRYYELAYNLLKSYRFFSDNPYPFAIIAEEENEFTKPFDEVILSDKTNRSFMDKLLVFESSPFDETIFIDADSLVYGDLNEYWKIFENATDFSALGENFNIAKKETGDCWYEVDGIGKYGIGVTHRCRVHAGVMFFRKSPLLTKTYEDLKNILNDYDNLKFTAYSASKDECSLAVAAAYNDMRMVVESNNFVFFPTCIKTQLDMSKYKFSFQTPWSGFVEYANLVHFGTPSTKNHIYQFSVKYLDYKTKYKNNPPPIKKIALR